MQNEPFKWGQDPQLDCEELQRLEELGTYPDGHHDLMCSIHNEEAPPVSNFVIPVDPPKEEVPPLEPREENTE